MFVKKAIDVAMSKTKFHVSLFINFSMSGIDDAHLFVITGTNTFPGNKSCYKAVRSCQSKDISSFS